MYGIYSGRQRTCTKQRKEPGSSPALVVGRGSLLRRYRGMKKRYYMVLEMSPIPPGRCESGLRCLIFPLFWEVATNLYFSLTTKSPSIKGAYVFTIMLAFQ